MSTSTIDMYQSAISFFDHPFFIIIGGIGTLIMVVTFILLVVSIIKGVIPVWYRLGIGISKRKLAIFANEENYKSLKDTLIDSGVFSEKNLTCIRLDNLEKAKGYSIFLVDWTTCQDKIDEIFSIRKTYHTPVIIHAQPGSILPQIMSDIANRPNTVVVNFRGRLLNDILTSLVTTAYER